LFPVSKRDSFEDGTGGRRSHQIDRSRIRKISFSYPEEPFPITGKELRCAEKLFNGMSSRLTKQGTEVDLLSSIYKYLLA
jgi:hypothetical protein